MNHSAPALRVNLCILFSMLIFYYCSSDHAKTVPAIHMVEIKAMKFQPADLLVKEGDTVIWINHDFVEHDVAEDPGKTWRSSIIPNGGSWSMVINRSSNYFCSIHQAMKGSIQVR